MLLSSLGSSIANVGLPTLAQAFDASFQQAQWIVLAYLLAITTLIVGVGRLGDLMGRRRLLLGGILLFTLSSALCGIAPSLHLLIAARAAQGLGAAVMMALTMAFVAGTVAKDRTGRAMGMLAAMSSFGTALGPTLGGLLISAYGWPAIFLVTVPLGALAWILARRFLPVDPPLPATRPRFDYLGTLLLALTLLAYALAMTLGRGGFGLLNLGLVGAALLGLGLFVLAETKIASPLIRLAVFRNPVLSTGFAMSVLVMTVMMSVLIVGPFYLSGALALSPAQVGLVMSSTAITAALAGVPAGRAVDRFGSARATRIALAAMAGACVVSAGMPGSVGIAGYVAPLVLVAAGYALFQAANNTAVMQDAEQRGVISGMLGLSRSLGSITGASVMGMVFAAASAGSGLVATHPQAVARGMHVTFAVAAGLLGLALLLAFGATLTRRWRTRASATDA
jgi:EmrB/QacA subfamily drug resistance transporter